jgi:type 1 glutamine amidotransferase
MAQAGARPARILLVTATAGYYHQSIPTARRVVHELAQESGDLKVGTVIEDVAGLDQLTPEALAAHDILCFVSTSGELPLTEPQKQGLLDFVAAGKGYVGVHCASATLKEWPEYGELVGAVFNMHPPALTFTVHVEDRAHPSTRHLPASFSIKDELYTFRANPRGTVRMLLRGESGAAGIDGDLPLAWTKTYGDGRVYYNALGHFDEEWEQPSFRAQIRQGLRWAARLAE